MLAVDSENSVPFLIASGLYVCFKTQATHKEIIQLYLHLFFFKKRVRTFCAAMDWI